MLKKIMFLVVAVLLMILITIPVRAGNSEVFSYHCPLGCPVAQNKDTVVVIHRQFISGIDKNTKWTIWTAYMVNKKNFGKRINHNFNPDPLLPSPLQKTQKDYKGLYGKYNIHRGHMAPASSFSVNKSISKPTYYLSNIQPQPAKLNTGIWKTIEQWERNNQPLYIMSGATLDKDLTKRIFWKIIVNKYSNYAYGLVFKKIKDKYCYQNMNISKLEQLTKLDFFNYYNIPQKKFNMKGACS